MLCKAMNLLSSTKTMMNALEFVPLKHVKNQFMVTNANATNRIRCINNLSLLDRVALMDN